MPHLPMQKLLLLHDKAGAEATGLAHEALDVEPLEAGHGGRLRDVTDLIGNCGCEANI